MNSGCCQPARARMVSRLSSCESTRTCSSTPPLPRGNSGFVYDSLRERLLPRAPRYEPADLVEQGEVKTGRRSEGVFFAANTFIMKVTTGIGVMAATVVLALAHFPEGVAPDQVPDSALITLGWWYLPAVSLMRLLMILSILPYAVDRKKHEENLQKLGAT